LCASSEAKVGWAKSNTAGQINDDENLMNTNIHYTGYWSPPVTINRNNFQHKSLSCWSINPFVGCQHACRFCYVPSVSAIKLKGPLGKLGVEDPDEQWGQYAFLRTWDESAFLKSLAKAERTPVGELPIDGNRAVMLSTTTDAYQTLRGSNASETLELNERAREMVRRMLELIRDRSTLNVRILTRSPLARQDFDLYKTFGDRLLFGMSLPTLNDQLARVYEPKAPAPSKRLETLKLAVSMGIPVYVAVAPTYPEQCEEDFTKVLSAVAALQPVTVFHEPINIRAGNVERMKREAQALGFEFKENVFATKENWEEFAVAQLIVAEVLATKLGLGSVFHSWPDPTLGSKRVRYAFGSDYSEWIDECWNRISAWPCRQQERMAA
jgi:DNA repair photolyase